MLMVEMRLVLLMMIVLIMTLLVSLGIGLWRRTEKGTGGGWKGGSD